MSWFGKIIGGGLGFALGGPIGAVLGAVLGHTVVDQQGGGFTAAETRQTIYFTATFSMLGKLAKADGVVSSHEIEIIERVMRDNMRLGPDARQFAINVFNAAKDSPEPFEAFAHQFREEFADSPAVMASLIELLLLVALADGEMHTGEQALIQRAAQIFGISAQEYQQIRSRFDNSEDIRHYYQVLGCIESDGMDKVKRAYRKLAMEYHPDRVQSRGMSPEFAAVAEDKFKDIQEAYDKISEHHRRITS